MMKNRIGVIEVLQFHAALTDADHFVQRHAARLMAHVRAIRQIVGAELPHEKLIQEGRFVARPATRIKRRGVWCGQRIQFSGDELKRIVPRDWLVVCSVFAFHHRMRQPPLLTEPEIALPAQIIERMLAKEVWRRSFSRCFIRDGFGAVFAKLGYLPFAIRTRPCTTLAIETVLLVELKQCLRSTRDAHLANRKPCDLIDRGQTGGDPRGLADSCFGRFHRRLRARRRIFLVQIRVFRWRILRHAVANVIRFLRDRIERLLVVHNSVRDASPNVRLISTRATR